MPWPTARRAHPVPCFLAMHDELRELYEADQADRRALRSAQPPRPRDLGERDRARLERVRALLDEGAAVTGEDHRHAAMVFQHSGVLEDTWRAHELALRAVELGDDRARWLAAAALDRWLTRQGRPQKYGTQYRTAGEAWELYEVDPETTDAERAGWNVPPLAEALLRAERMTAERPPPAGMPDSRPLVTCRAGDVEIQVVRVDTAVQTVERPPAEPAEPDDPLPWLPSGLTPGRIGPGFGATEEGGEIAVSWLRVDMPLVVGWREEDGPAPAPEATEIGGRAAVWCSSSAGWSMLAVSRPGAQPWVVAGSRTRDELSRVAASLP